MSFKFKKKIEDVFVHDPINEKMVLSAMILDYQLRRRLSSELSEDDFFVGKHKVIYNILISLEINNVKYNEDTFIVQADALGINQSDFGGVSYLRELEEIFVPNNQNIEYHIDILRQDSIRAHVYTDQFFELEQLLLNKGSLADIDFKIEEMRQQIVGKMKIASIVNGEQALIKYAEDLKSRGSEDFVGTSYGELDSYLIEGLARKKLSVWTGFSGSGKTTFLSNVIKRIAAKNKYNILVCPLEVGMVSMLDTFVCIEGGFYVEDLIKRFEKLPIEEKKAIYLAAKAVLKNQRIFFTEKADFGFKDLRTLLNKTHFDIVVIDLFEKMREVRNNLEANNISRWLDTLQVMAQDYNVHFAITAQLKRDELRNKKGKARRPMLESLKNSGKYVEVADLIIGLFRKKYLEPDTTDRDLIETIILKQRRGVANKTFKYEFNGPKLTIGKFVDDSDDDDDDTPTGTAVTPSNPPDEFDVYS